MVSVLKTMSGEMSLLRKEINVPWNETTLPTFISNYKLTNIFNAEEFGCFINVWQLKRLTYLEKSTLAARIAKLD